MACMNLIFVQAARMVKVDNAEYLDGMLEYTIKIFLFLLISFSFLICFNLHFVLPFLFNVFFNYIWVGGGFLFWFFQHSI